MTGEARRRTVTRTVTLEQPIESVWATLVDPQAPMWLTPKAAYVVAPPEAPEGLGTLRCCWLEQWKKGLRQQIIWELLIVEPGRQATFLSRSSPGHGSYEFQLTADGAGTRVDLVHQKRASFKDRLPGRERAFGPSEDPTTRLIAAAAGELPLSVTPSVMTWAPGISGREQVSSTIIAAPPKRVWSIVENDNVGLANWRSVVDGVEYRYAVNDAPGHALVAEMASFIPQGAFRLTTVDSRGVEVAYELLPHEDACLLRTTTRWTALIKAKAIRTATQAWLAAVKKAAEQPAA